MVSINCSMQGPLTQVADAAANLSLGGVLTCKAPWVTASVLCCQLRPVQDLIGEEVLRWEHPVPAERLLGLL